MFVAHLSRTTFSYGQESDSTVSKVENKESYLNHTSKVGGHAYQPWVKYYFEYELSRGLLLDYRIMIEKWPTYMKSLMKSALT